MNDLDRTGPFHPAEPAAAPPAAVGRYRVERVLGHGGFGVVYLAHDDQLQRPVAVKVPHPDLLDRPAAYLAEARSVARLDHPNIVPVHDVGSAADCPVFIVSKYVDGSDLAARLKASPLPRADVIDLVATVAEALHHAHKHGIVHRDVKPGNLLLDRAGKPFVADFGLALREQDVGTGPRFAGTAAYMSPEQARGEGHRVDGRSDVFSLGVVLYQLLAGRLPFRAESPVELLEQVVAHEPRPLRQVDETIPKELERICFKAMAKRASERYLTARDFADDLRQFQREAPSSSVAASPPTAEPPAPSAARPPSTDRPPVRVVPKGLRSFDAHDADFFLDLLPGPRDRDGLPDAVRFWKARVEEPDADAAFAVGLLYGPSGCGKSSLMKAGLLPRLAASVVPVYVEATAGETEARLLTGLRKRCPTLDPALSLKESLAALRRGHGLPPGRKALLVIDQFEQWLHARKDDEAAELVQALRQCDGGRVQCVVLVRDDFWMAATRFMRDLEVRLVEGENSAAVDLFPVRHAEKVLTAFGRAFGALPDGELDAEQRRFLEQSVAGLAEDGKVISVRLALFAEMMKGRAWTPAALKAVGGTAGVGVTFLEETFSAATAPPEHRYHQKAARAALRALLPDAGGDIKGHMRSHAELLAASGYAARPRDFDELLRILDTEIRLITPTDPDGHDAAPPAAAGQRYYQLTHDYLVHPVREWLTRKQKETRRGRAELLLADLSAMWAVRRENAQLPSSTQWLSIRWWTVRRDWTPTQHAMMRKAGRVYARMVLLLAAVVIANVALWVNVVATLHARSLRDRLLEAATADTPTIVMDLEGYRWWVDPLLRDAYRLAEGQKDARKQLHASLGLVGVDAGQVDFLIERLLTGQPQEVIAIRQVLAGQELATRLWPALESPTADPNRRLRAAAGLAAYAPFDPRWAAVADDVAATLVVQKPFVVAQWTDALKPVGTRLLPSLAGFLVDENRSVAERGLIASVYGAYAADGPDAFARLEAQLSEAPAPDATAEAKVALAKRHAAVAVALLVMGRDAKAWPLLAARPDPTARGYLIDRPAPAGVNPKVLIARLAEEKDTSVRRGILLCLGEYGLDRMSATERRNHLPALRDLYRDDPDPGVHAAAEWALRQWGDDLTALDAPLATGTVEGPRGWYRTRQGQTMVVVPRADRTFALAAKEVTIGEFRRFRPGHAYNKWYARTPDCPAVNVLWYDAAAYCNWLSDKDGIPKDQWCYRPNAAGQYAEGMTTAPDYLARTGYRLPTEAEWEFAARAGAETDYSFGLTVELLDRYGWYDGTSHGTSHPVGSRRPNDRGLFDAHGNVWEWCQNAFAATDDAAGPPVTNAVGRALRGGSFNNQPTLTRTANRNDFGPATQDDAVGFRPARTVRP